jgi:hypothetical protein
LTGIKKLGIITAMDYGNTILIAIAILTLYGAIRLVTDIISAITFTGRTIKKITARAADMIFSNSAQTVKKQREIIDLPYRAIHTEFAPLKIDKRHKYQVNVEACEAYLASRRK